MSDERLILQEPAVIRVTNAAKIELKANTVWNHIGQIDQGDVYRTCDQVVVVNSFDVFEAAIVVSESNLVGFYLPIEKSFVEAKQPTALQFTTE
ncbi:MAG: hypothetical protein AAGJ86_07710 [Pseudomonadota bacterium]